MSFKNLKESRAAEMHVFKSQYLGGRADMHASSLVSLSSLISKPQAPVRGLVSKTQKLTRIKLRVTCTLGKYFITELHPWPATFIYLLNLIVAQACFRILG